jgi:hypothetical protein
MTTHALALFLLAAMILPILLAAETDNEDK